MVADLVSDRQTALWIKATRYIGSDCSKGHGNIRYVKNGACVKCAKIVKAAYNARVKTHFVCEEYLIAKANKEIHFTRTKPCIKCNTHSFYTNNRTCVNCVANANLRSEENAKLASEAKSLGMTAYVPNKPCKHGHALRYIESNNCVECGKLIRIRMKDVVKIKRLLKEYDLPEDKYWEMVDEQNSSCKICKLYVEDNFKLHVDHCHDTGKVRGLLCTNCNIGIGNFKHSSGLLHQAALYCEEA